MEEPAAAVWLPGDFQQQQVADWRWSMQPSAVWAPSCGFQLPDWSMQPAQASSLWAPGFPVDYSYVPSSRQVQVQYAAGATEIQAIEKAARHQEFEVDLHIVGMNEHTTDHDPVNRLYEEAAHELEFEDDIMAWKIHRYPASLLDDLDEKYTVPKVVAIGPYYQYHHGRGNLQTKKLKAAAEVKYAAAYRCAMESGYSVQELSNEVAAAAAVARLLYDNDVVAGINDGDFLQMMLLDACFLVQYLVWCTKEGHERMDASLRIFFNSNDDEIFHDITLLENQLPWQVVKVVMKYRSVEMKEFIASYRGCLKDRKDAAAAADDDGGDADTFEIEFEPPHLLGLLRYYIVRRSGKELQSTDQPRTRTKSISFSVSAMELAEIGITLTPTESTELVHMGITKEGAIFSELSMAPLSLDNVRASLLVNMAALELCTTPNFQAAEDEDSAVCSYLLLLGMLVDREEDVHELRARHLLQGGGGFTNQEALVFFKSLQGLRLGSRYVRAMEEIEDYKVNRPVRTKVHAIYYKHKKTMAKIFTITVALIGILGTLKTLKIL